MFKTGLKLWSTNIQYIPEARRLFQKLAYDYIELFSIPDSFNKTIHAWRELHIPFIIHAAHYTTGMNLADKSKVNENAVLAKEAFQFAESLFADIVIFHAGVNGTIESTIRQLKRLNDDRICIENKPYYGLNNELCVGHAPQDIERIINIGTHFCLDFGHAICAANALSLDPFSLIDQFFLLKPTIFHLTDGDYCGIHDKHEHYGQGSFPLKKIIKYIPDDARLTNEAKKDSEQNLDDFEKDIHYLKSLSF